MKLLFTVFALATLVVPTGALLADDPALTEDDASNQKLRQLVMHHVQPMLDAKRVVGGVVGIVRRGEAAVVGCGEIERGGGQAPDATTIYEIGSITKAFTGTLLAEMSLQDGVKLDDSLQSYLPEGVQAPQRGDKPITLRHLATHTSGLPRLPSDLPATDPNPYAKYDSIQLYEFLGAYKPGRLPGKSEYSNLGMGLLGTILAERAGRSYEDLIVERIAEPLEMNDTRIKLTEQQLSRSAPPYTADLAPGHRWDFDSLAGCGALRSTVADLLKFATAAMNEGDGQKEDDAIHKAFALAFEKQPVGAMGLGWQIAADGVTRWHNGQTSGYSGALFIIPPAKTAVVMLTNTACDKTTQVCERIVQATLGMNVDPVKFESEVSVDPATLKRYVGKYRLGLLATITITLEEGQLKAQLTGQDSFPIFPKSETKFFYKIVPAEITFEMDDDGAVTKLTLHQNGQDMPASRIGGD